jgi:hypothetical protein
MQTYIAPSAIAPIPLDHFTLPEVVALLAAKITNRDIEKAPPPAALEALFGPLDRAPRIDSGNSSESLAFWLKREQAILETSQALADGSLPAIIWDPAMRAFVRLLPEDWRQAAFQDQMVRCGVVRSSAGERIGPHEGGRPLIDKADVFKRLGRRQRSKPAAAAQKCADWLEQKMRASPEHKPQPKPAYCREAVENFGVSVRQFNAIWKSAIAKTGARWDQRGRPSKSERYNPG